MIRSTTPTIQCILDDKDKEIIAESLGNIYITLQQGPIVLTKKNVIVEDNTISINLTQKNTLMFKPGVAKVQIKGKTS